MDKIYKGIIYNEFGEIAQRVTLVGLHPLIDWFASHGVSGKEWYNVVDCGTFRYYHRPQCGYSVEL